MRKSDVGKEIIDKTDTSKLKLPTKKDHQKMKNPSSTQNMKSWGEPRTLLTTRENTQSTKRGPSPWRAEATGQHTSHFPAYFMMRGSLRQRPGKAPQEKKVMGHGYSCTQTQNKTNKQKPSTKYNPIEFGSTQLQTLRQVPDKY